jgi:hypothetical protein
MPEQLEFGVSTGQDSPLDAHCDYPLATAVTLELLAHTKALQVLFQGEHPIMVPIHPTDKYKLWFFVGDASREGFGGSTQYPAGLVSSHEGLWDPEVSEGGSNLREAQNQVNHLISEIRAGFHDGCEVWAATDNSVWSAVWNKGLSSARHLFYLVLVLKQEAR